MMAGAVIVAAGRGERFGEAGKVLANVADRPMLAWSLDAFQTRDAIGSIVVVAGAHTISAIQRLVDTGAWPKVQAVVPGGEQRSQSVANGIAALDDVVDIVVIHDAARPLVTHEVIDGAILAAREYGGAIVATPVTDTLKQCESGLSITRTIDRSTLWAAQTPQAFRRTDLIEAFALGRSEALTDESMLFESLGMPVES